MFGHRGDGQEVRHLSISGGLDGGFSYWRAFPQGWALQTSPREVNHHPRGSSFCGFCSGVQPAVVTSWCPQGCQPVRNFRILYGFYMQNTGVRIWPTKYGNWALSVLSLKVLLSEQSLPVLGSNSVKFGGILCLKPFKYLFNHQNIQSSLFHMW